MALSLRAKRLAERNEKKATETTELELETRDRDVEDVSRAWERPGATFHVDASACKLDKQKPKSGWPVKLTAVDNASTEVVALTLDRTYSEIEKRVGRALRPHRLGRPLCAEDYCETWGASFIAILVGVDEHGNVIGVVIFQKRVHLLKKSKGHYCSSLALPWASGRRSARRRA